MSNIGSVEQLLRVNHAGECGAIWIYRSQIAIAGLFHPGCVAELQSMLAHERVHFARFDAVLKNRGIRHCHALVFWACGGWLLGIVTALMGPKAIWSCTPAIETRVNLHLEHQIAFLEQRDDEILKVVRSIQADEKAHEQHARGKGGDADGVVYRGLRVCIVSATSFAIWLSTQL
jgi:3-demethoxyubiquinol 3-hydroxylase